MEGEIGHAALEHGRGHGASMRPPRNGGGNVLVGSEGRITVKIGFNEAPPQWRGKSPEVCESSAGVPCRFNEAPPQWRGKWRCPCRAVRRYHSFNEAPPQWRGKSMNIHIEKIDFAASMRPPRNGGGNEKRQVPELTLDLGFNEAPPQWRGKYARRARGAHLEQASMRPPRNGGGNDQFASRRD